MSGAATSGARDADVPNWRDQFGRHIKDPLNRNGYFLVASSVLSSGFGLIFWWLAARSFSVEAVGVGSTAISAMTLLANLASFNLLNGLNRFVPRAGRATSRLVASSYAVAATSGLVAGLVFVAGLSVWAPSLAVLRSSPGMIAWFALSVGAWTLFVIQDGALTGLRATSWVTIENLGYAGLKIVALLFMARMVTEAGVFIAWTVPVVPLVIVVNVMMFRRLVPAHEARTEPMAEDVSGSIVRRFVAGDYSASLVWMATSNLLPLLVLERAGAAAAAYFYLAWTVAYVLYLVGRNFGMSMLTEAASEPARADALTFQAMRQTALLVVPAVVVVVAGAPLVLRLFGEAYSQEGTALLRLLALAAIPSIVTTAYIALLRARRRMKLLLLFMIALSGAVLPLSWFLLDSLGIVGVGIAWLAVHTVAAIVLAMTAMRNVFVAHLSPRLLSRLGDVRRVASRWRGSRRTIEMATAALEIVQKEAGLPRDWRPLRSIGGVTDVHTISVGPDSDRERAVVKLGLSELGASSLQRAAKALEVWASDERLAEWRPLVPELLGQGRAEDHYFTMESLVAGTRADLLANEPAARTRILLSATGLAGRLGRRTSGPEGSAQEWLAGRVSVIRECLARSGFDGLVPDLERLAGRAASSLSSVQSSAVHGDFWLGNLFVDAATLEVVGLVDWDAWSMAGPADLDVITLLLTTRVFVDRRETGQVVLSLLSDEPWTRSERDLLELGDSPSWSTGEEAIRVAWLHSVALLLEQSDRYQPGSAWFLRNVASILPVVSREPRA